METKKILVVDDELINTEFLHETLVKNGFDVETAGDGEDALSKLEYFLPDLILLDIIMPKMSGWELAEILYEHPIYKHIPIIIFSALGNTGEIARAMELGVKDFVIKPVNLSDLLKSINSVFEGE